MSLRLRARRTNRNDTSGTKDESESLGFKEPKPKLKKREMKVAEKRFKVDAVVGHGFNAKN